RVLLKLIAEEEAMGQKPLNGGSPGRSPVPTAARAVISAAALCLAGSALAQTADLVMTNGKVFTADATSSLAQAFAVKDGRFIAVGSSEAMQKLAGATTKVIDVKGRFVT